MKFIQVLLTCLFLVASLAAKASNVKAKIDFSQQPGVTQGELKENSEKNIVIVKAQNIDCWLWVKSNWIDEWVKSGPSHENYFTWDKGCDNGLISGRGTLQWYNNNKKTDRYNVQVVDGYIDGVGALLLSNNNYFEGNFKKSEKSGKGGYRDSQKGDMIYLGNWESDKMHGAGQCILGEAHRDAKRDKLVATWDKGKLLPGGKFLPFSGWPNNPNAEYIMARKFELLYKKHGHPCYLEISKVILTRITEKYPESDVAVKAIDLLMVGL